jgi:mono/diheme cytochrome c family protein
MRYFFLTFFFLTVIVVSWAGFRGDPFERPPIEVFPDMDRQAKVKAQTPSGFFADGLGAREPVSHTIPMGYEIPEVAAADGGIQEFAFTQGTDYYNTGMMGDYYGDGFPSVLTVDQAFVSRGMELYTIHCKVCHGASGNGKGVTSQYGILNAASFHAPEYLDSANPVYRPDGSIFQTITHGKGLMGPYGANITVKDRWAIISYIRVLQESGKVAKP